MNWNNETLIPEFVAVDATLLAREKTPSPKGYVELRRCPLDSVNLEAPESAESKWMVSPVPQLHSRGTRLTNGASWEARCGVYGFYAGRLRDRPRVPDSWLMAFVQARDFIRPGKPVEKRLILNPARYTGMRLPKTE